MYEDVWNMPLGRVAEKWGVSGTTLSRVCVRLHIPAPTLGYRTKRKAGKEAIKPNFHQPHSTSALAISQQVRRVTNSGWRLVPTAVTTY